ncbi:hypothetical protein B0H11DRAFT_1907925 [Mycena galericulata]|nr:hypothetical protein B0H11DRAFT_1928647 [Mycena galericulata]KAJ7501475.1 hypothetical protein B0H11DRAFT_1907925 [Mycena galericulata]
MYPSDVEGFSPLDTVPATLENTRDAAASFVHATRACEGVNRRQSWAGFQSGGASEVRGDIRILPLNLDSPEELGHVTGSGKEKDGQKSAHPKIQMSESLALREPAEHQLRTADKLQEQDLGAQQVKHRVPAFAGLKRWGTFHNGFVR